MFHVLATFLCLTSTAVFVTSAFSSSPSLHVADDGSIHVNPAAGHDVFVNGVSWNDTLNLITALTSTSSRLAADLGTLQSEGNLIKEYAAAISAAIGPLQMRVSAIAAQPATTSGSATSSTTTAYSTGASAAMTTTATTSTTDATNITSTTTVATSTTSSTLSLRSACSLQKPPQLLPKKFQSFATFTTSNGTVFMMAAQDTQSILFRYSGNLSTGFVTHQFLYSPPTSSFYSKIGAFKIQTSQYVALPFYADLFTLNYRCEIFVFNETLYQLQSIQNISTFGAQGVAVTTAQKTGQTYLFVSNFKDQSGWYIQPSYIMKFRNSSGVFEHMQNITVNGAYPAEFFDIDTDTYLAVPNEFDGSTHKLNSTIYILDTSSGTFVVKQTIPTVGASHIKPWVRNLEPLLSVVNYRGDYVDTYKYSSSLGIFENVTSGGRLACSYPNGADVIEIAGTTYMVVAPFNTTVNVFKWNATLFRFEHAQQFSVTYDWHYPHFFSIGFETFLAIGNLVLKFCEDQFVVS
jgi:hypothetical protein